MKIKFLVLALVLLAVAICSYAADDKISVSFNNTPIKTCLDTIFKGSGKSYGISPNVQNGYINLVMNDQPFNKVLTKILDQVGATYDLEDGYYSIKPNQNAYNQMGGGMGMGGNMGMGNQGGMGMGGNMGMGNQGGMGMGGNMGMGNQGGMNGQTSTTKKLTNKQKIEKKIKKIKVFYNSGEQVLAMMDGEEYSDVVYSGGGSSNSSGSSSSSSSNSSSSSSRSSSSSSSNR